MAARPLGRWWLAAAVVVAWAAPRGSARASWRGGRWRRVPALPDLRAALPVGGADGRGRAEARRPGRQVGVGRACHAAQSRDGALAPTAWPRRSRRTTGRGPTSRAAARRAGRRPPSRRSSARHRGGAGHGQAWFRLGEAHFKARPARRGAARRAEAAPAVAAFPCRGVASRQTWPLGAYAGVALARVELERGDQRAAAAHVPREPPTRLQCRRGTAAPDRRAADRPGSYVPPADPGWTRSWPTPATATCCSNTGARDPGRRQRRGASSSCGGRSCSIQTTSTC